MNPIDHPMKVSIENDQLVIRIGIDTLAFAAEHCPEFYDDEKHAHSGPPYVKVTNKMELARDVVSRLNHEEEDGTTPLHVLFDNAFRDAFDDGSLGFDENK